HLRNVRINPTSQGIALVGGEPWLGPRSSRGTLGLGRLAAQAVGATRPLSRRSAAPRRRAFVRLLMMRDGEELYDVLACLDVARKRISVGSPTLPNRASGMVRGRWS